MARAQQDPFACYTSLRDGRVVAYRNGLCPNRSSRHFQMWEKNQPCWHLQSWSLACEGMVASFELTSSVNETNEVRKLIGSLGWFSYLFLMILRIIKRCWIYGVECSGLRWLCLRLFRRFRWFHRYRISFCLFFATTAVFLNFSNCKAVRPPKQGLKK